MKHPIDQQLARCVAVLGGSRDGLVAYHVPGRIEVLGKHTDYAGGRSIVAAAEQGFTIAARARSDRLVRMVDASANEPTEFYLEPELQPAQGSWANYPMTVARRIARNFPGPLRGAEIVFTSDLPPAAGMSSSSALMIACYLVLAEINQLAQRCEHRENINSNESLAAYLATIENGQSFGTLEGDHGVGTFGGSEDHTAILCAQRLALSQYSFCPIRLERTIEMPQELVFAIAASGVLAEKTRDAKGKYNLVSLRASAIVQAWREQTSGDQATLAAIVRSGPSAVEQLRSILSAHPPEGFTADELLRRLDQFVAESEQIIPAFAEALAAGRWNEAGELADRSQQLAGSHLENQVPQTVTLAHEARQLGALAASSFGAGFGGSVWALIRAGESEAFLHAWRRRYSGRHAQFADRARFFLTRPGAGAAKLRRPITRPASGQ